MKEYFAILTMRGPVCHSERQGSWEVLIHAGTEAELDEKIKQYSGAKMVQKFESVQISIVLNEENCV